MLFPQSKKEFACDVVIECPASMCPLVAPDGSPWNGKFADPCPGHGDVHRGGCAWWELACATGGIQRLVEEAATCGGKRLTPMRGPNKPRRDTIGPSREYDCPKASFCRWQLLAEKDGRELCPPRDALRRGMDPRVVLY